MENRTEDRNIVSAEDAEQRIDAVEVTKNEETEEKKKKKWIPLLILFLLLLFIAAGVGGYRYWKEASRPKSKYETDMNALPGFLPGKTKEQIEAELNRIIEEGRFNASINSEMTLENGKLNVHIENVPANNYDMMVEVYLYPTQNRTDDAELIYQSKIVKRGFYIEDADASTSVAPGLYDGLAVFHAIMPDDTQEEIGQTAFQVVIRVQ